MLADRAVAAKKDVDKAKPGVAAQKTRDNHSQCNTEENIYTLTSKRQLNMVAAAKRLSSPRPPGEWTVHRTIK